MAMGMDSTIENVCLFDMDGTLADYAGQLERDMARLAAPGDPKFLAVHDEHYPRYIERRMHLIKTQRDWWLNLPKLQLGFDLLNAARSTGFKIHVLTKGPRKTPDAWAEKLKWCQKHIADDVDITITFDKGLVYGKVLVDDYPDYAERWLTWRPRGLVVMPAAPVNRSFSHPNVVKYDGSLGSLKQVTKRMQMAFDRRPQEQSH
jgi:5'-nucleotidase